MLTPEQLAALDALEVNPSPLMLIIESLLEALGRLQERLDQGYLAPSVYVGKAEGQWYPITVANPHWSLVFRLNPDKDRPEIHLPSVGQLDLDGRDASEVALAIVSSLNAYTPDFCFLFLETTGRTLNDPSAVDAL